MGLICAVIADSKGRNPIGWFFIGFFFPLIGLILVLVLSNLKEAQDKELAMETEQRRLREQLRQERLKNEQFRKHAQIRLDTHDTALGMSTRNAPVMLPGESEMLDDGYRAPERGQTNDDLEPPEEQERDAV